jgi:hypothetical protein
VIKSRPKILIFSLSPPENNGGVRVLLYRHFFLHDDFDFSVITDSEYSGEGKPFLKVEYGAFWSRLKKTRFHRLATDWINLLWPSTIPRSVHEWVQSYSPDAIFTIADNSLSHMAARVAKHYRLPLIVFYMDWVPVLAPWVGTRASLALLHKRFRHLYHKADLAFCISEGMKEELGHHPNAAVVLPIPGRSWESSGRNQDGAPVGKPLLLYTGNSSGAYGNMICRLMDEILKDGEIDFRIVSPNPDWSTEHLEKANRHGIFLGYKNTNELADLYRAADFLLVVMGFDKNEELFMRTCFTTKFSDYCSWGKPIVLWSPAYTAPARLIGGDPRSLVILQNEPALVVEKIKNALQNTPAYEGAASLSIELQKENFNPAKVQTIFSQHIMQVVHPNEKFIESPR